MGFAYAIQHSKPALEAHAYACTRLSFMAVSVDNPLKINSAYGESMYVICAVWRTKLVANKLTQYLIWLKGELGVVSFGFH